MWAGIGMENRGERETDGERFQWNGGYRAAKTERERCGRGMWEEERGKEGERLMTINHRMRRWRWEKKTEHGRAAVKMDGGGYK